MKNSIRLRPLNAGDLDLLFAWINDRDLVKFNSDYRPVSWQEHLDWFSRINAAENEKYFGIEVVCSRLLIGSCSLRKIDKALGNAELQIRIGDSRYWSFGLGTQAVKHLVNYAFSNLNLKKVYLFALTDNDRAVKCYQKAGFKVERLQKNKTWMNGHLRDLKLMSISKSQTS
jgi:RimJ/RimL family protein N-acetyltransferase